MRRAAAAGLPRRLRGARAARPAPRHARPARRLSSPPREPSERVPVTLGGSAAVCCAGTRVGRHAAGVQLAGAVRGPARAPRPRHRAHVHCSSAAPRDQRDAPANIHGDAYRRV